MLTLESQARLHLYMKLFTSLPFPFMRAITLRIFKTEEKEYPNSILQLVQESKHVLRYSERLSVINSCFNINSLNTMMATLVCDTFQEFFSNLGLITLVRGFNSAIGGLYGNDVQPLRRIASIAFLKEFAKKLWNYFIMSKRDSLMPITYFILDETDFDGALLIEQFTN